MSDLLDRLRTSHPDVSVWAAGGVITRRTGSHTKVLIVHRPRYDDWSLPKGKLDEGESLKTAALREVLEETGYSCSVGERLPVMIYTDGKGRSKAVVYWTMTIVSGKFRSNSEVDEAKWVRPGRAAKMLDYQRDVELLRGCVPGVPESS